MPSLTVKSCTQYMGMLLQTVQTLSTPTDVVIREAVQSHHNTVCTYLECERHYCFNWQKHAHCTKFYQKQQKQKLQEGRGIPLQAS